MKSAHDHEMSSTGTVPGNRTDIHYPADWERSARTRDGLEYFIRPIRANDLERERAFIMGLSPQSRYSRMMVTMREPSAALLEQFVRVDYCRDMAFVALTGNIGTEHIIGVARYAADPDGPGCEFAVAVTDEWQGKGVGATLTQLLIDYAQAQGFHRLHGDVLVSNTPMLELVHWLGMKTERSPEDRTLLEASRML